MISWVRLAALVPMAMAMSLEPASADQRSGSAECPMAAPQRSYALPAEGFIDADAPKPLQACDPPSGEWLRGALGARELAVNPAGPEGSGRYWIITVGLAEGVGATPTRGVCMETSTAGFRSLRSFGGKPLPWVADIDDDGLAEFVLWESFFLTPRLEQSETGLVAWVYRVDLKSNTLALDLALSRRMAKEIAAAYRTSLPAKEIASNPGLQEERRLAATALGALAADRCTVRQENRR